MNLARSLSKNVTFLLTTFCCGMFALGQGLPATNELPMPATQSETTSRYTINARFDDSSKLLYKLDAPIPAGQGQGEVVDRVRIQPIPASEADVIIVGQVQKHQSYFSNDHTRIYTEFSVIPEETLKGNSPLSSYTVLMSGGAIKKSTGQVISYHNDRPELLLPGHRYVLFLKYDPPTRTYFAIKEWGLSTGHPYPMNREDMQDLRNHKSETVGMSEAEFLSAIRAAINHN